MRRCVCGGGGCMRWAVGVQASESWMSFFSKEGALDIREHFDWSFWLVVFSVPSADRTPSKVNKDSLFLSSLSTSRSIPVLTDDIGPCLWHLVFNAKL